MPSSPKPHRSGKQKPKPRSRLAGCFQRKSDKFYCSAAWRKLRQAVLNEKPLCKHCEARGIVTAASEVHHIKRRRDYPELSLVRSNLEALCKPCHSSETLREINRDRRSRG